jgi:tetratricopeptide (TPR) repeat protein
VDVSALPVLLVDLGRRRFSGILEVRDGQVSKQFTWAEGVPTLAESSRPSERLAATLAERGYLDASARARLEQHHRATGRRELACAVELRLLAPSELLEAVREHLRGCLVQIFSWRTLESELRAAEAEAAAGPGIDPLAVVQEGIECHWSLERVVESLGAKASRHATAEPGARALAKRLRGGDDVDQLLSALDGHRTLGECLYSAATPRAFATAWLLDAAGTLSYADAPPREEGASEEPEIEVVVSDRVAMCGDASSSPDGPDADVAGGRQAAELRAEVERIHAAMDGHSYYQLLTVEPGAETAEIRQAYRAAAKRLHPDALARLGLDDLKEKANELFSRISLAHATLTDPARRREYDESCDGSTQETADRLVRAETLYRKALVLLRAGRFADAVPPLESCVSLWPEEAVYHSDLGWALFKIAVPRHAEARAALERAVQLDRSAGLPLFRLSFVLAALGEDEMARALRARAQRLDPSLGG